MNNKFIKFNFDMRKKEYLEKMKKYYMAEEVSISNDKKYFKKYYDIDISKYNDEKKIFSIPYEMADLYCLMMAVMKSSPTYDNRKKESVTLENIVYHNKLIIDSLDNLPAYIADYIKVTPEYCNAVYLINYVPVILERISALLHLMLDINDNSMGTEIFEYLIDGLDDVYERRFWKKARTESAIEWFSKNKDISNKIGINYEEYDLKVYYSLSYRLAEFFNELDRNNWSTENEAIIRENLKKWEEKYKDDKDKDKKVKEEYLFWLCNQKWHVLNKNANSLFNFSSESINDKISKYNSRYDITTVIPNLFLDDNKSKIENNDNHNIITQECLEELHEIEIALQSSVDSYIIFELMQEKNDLKRFKELFKQPSCKCLSHSISSYIETLLNQKSSEDIYYLLSLFLESVYSILNNNDNKYEKYGLQEYVSDIIKGSKSVTECCPEIYKNLYVKIQSKKCEYFNASKKYYKDFIKSMGLDIGNLYKNIMKKDIPK